MRAEALLEVPAKPEALTPTWDEIVENERQTELLEEKLTVKRPWYSRIADKLKDLSWYDIWQNKGRIVGIAVCAAAVVAIFYYGSKSRLRNLAELADSRKPGIHALFEPGSLARYTDEIRDASAGGTPPDVLEALLRAIQQNPDYAESARAAGKVGIIPLDPYAVGIRHGILESDDALCLRVAAGIYSRIREGVDTDTQALAIFFSSQEDYDNAMSKARQLETGHLRTEMGKWEKETLEKHRTTVELIEKHKKGELSDENYWFALIRGTSHITYSKSYSSKRGMWKQEFEKAISGEGSCDGSKFKLNPREYPFMRIMSDEYLAEISAKVEKYEDFTTHLPGPVGNAVRTARDFLNQ